MIDAVTLWLAASTTGQSADSFIAGMLLPVFSVIGVLLSTSLNHRLRFIGFCCGLGSQPIWFYVAIQAENLGLFINSAFFTLMWLYRFLPALKAVPAVESAAHVNRSRGWIGRKSPGS